MNIKETNAIRKLLKEHKPIAQEGVGYIKEDNGRSLTLPVLCECGEGFQSYWNDKFSYTAWLDHIQVQLLDMEP